MIELAAAAATPAAVAIGAAGLRRSVRRSKWGEQRRRTVEALRVLQSVAVAGGAVPYAADGLVEVLHLRSCRHEAGPAGEGGVPVLAEDGSLAERIQRRDRTGLLLPEVVHLAGAGGRFVLRAHPERSTTLEERLVAVAIAALAGARIDEPAPERPGPSPP